MNEIGSLGNEPRPANNALSHAMAQIAGSLLAEAVGFFRAKKSSACLPSEGK
jgi:hypothetical protein